MGFNKIFKRSNFLIFLVITITFINLPEVKSDNGGYFFTITGLTYNYTTNNAFMSDLKQQLLSIGINLEVNALPWSDFLLEYVVLHNYDLYFHWNLVPNFLNSTFSPIGYDPSLDHDPLLGTGKNLWYLDTFDKIVPADSTERKQHYHDWQDYLMDEILPCYPLFNKRHLTTYWDNLHGYNSTNGIIQSVGSMYFDSLHLNQANISELILSMNLYYEPNPLFGANDQTSVLIKQSALDPLVWVDGDKSYWPHLATSWNHLNDTHVRFTIRDNISWNIDPEGLFPSENLTTEDIYFSFYCYYEISEGSSYYQYIKSYEIINETTIDFVFDGDPDTPELDVWAGYLDFMSAKPILPEHYLNQTQLVDGITPDKLHPSWGNFSRYCFGTGPYKIDNFIDADHINLTLYENSWRLETDLLLDPKLNWENRFGNNWSIKKIRIENEGLYQENVDNFLLGNFDIYNKVPSDYIEQIPTTSTFDFQYQFDEYVQHHIGFNIREDRELMGNRDPCPNNENISQGVALRKSISYAINIASFSGEGFEPLFYRTYHPIPLSQGIWCSPTIIQYSYSLSSVAYYMSLLGYDINDIPGASSTIVGFPVSLVVIMSNFPFALIVLKRKKKR